MPGEKRIRKLVAQIIGAVNIELQSDDMHGGLSPSVRQSLEAIKDLACQAAEVGRPNKEQDVQGQLILEQQIEQDQSQ